MDEKILAKELPNSLIESIMETLSVYTIGFLRIDSEVRNPPADLIGTGVLVSAQGTRAILTAHHVAELLPSSGRIGLFLSRTTQAHTIPRDGVEIVKIARGRAEASGPDLATILLSPPVAGSVAAIKSFYNLDKVRDQLLTNPPSLDMGAWFAQGFLDERTTVGFDRIEPDLTKYFYNFTGVGAPDRIEQVGEHDYFDFPVSDDARSEAPVRWGGMSGGGVWQVQIRRSEGHLAGLPPLLSGLMFYQHPTTTTSCGIRCHGRDSIYRIAYNAMPMCGRG